MYYCITEISQVAKPVVVQHNNPANDWEDTADEGTGLGCVDQWRNAGPEE